MYTGCEVHTAIGGFTNVKTAALRARKTIEVVESEPCSIGIDLGDRFSHFCILDNEGEIIEEGRLRTTRDALRKRFEQLPAIRIALEAGTHSGWVSRLLEEIGHEVVVANPRDIFAITHSDNKHDRVDAEKLARYVRVDPVLLNPIQHRSEEQQLDLSLIRMREKFVGARTMLLNAARGIVKGFGHRLPSCSTNCFAERCREVIPVKLRSILTPLLEQIASLSKQIAAFDREVDRLALAKYPETAPLLTVNGVGTLTAVTFVLTLGDKNRFRHSRDVGCYLGLRPKRHQSGSRDPELGITKRGNRYMRCILVQCAQHILRSISADSALKRWGLKLAGRNGRNAKKRALIAVARKLAVLLHRLWVTQENFDPFYGCGKTAA
jgi:transposase